MIGTREGRLGVSIEFRCEGNNDERGEGENPISNDRKAGGVVKKWKCTFADAFFGNSRRDKETFSLVLWMPSAAPRIILRALSVASSEFA